MRGASFFSVRNMDHLVELKEFNFHPTGSIQRKFKLETIEEVSYLLKTYIENFAFGILYKNVQFSLYKESDAFYIRNNNAQIFKNKFDQPPITSVYDLKTDDFGTAISFIESV
ncbi:hypothetical protein [Paenibacillus illinoisensis]|uniref:Cytosine-specific methyltransferase n=1 Tax=Paenibacillus illinoisensis TaxID=59845 RepID=A0A2W0C8G4_9BACL|nr:hypothetical protein [Paenibacillus illinoisensis]PYY28294.1 Cytosine-specific methyltransferase [Paenibacillus illinoisensis]